MPFGFFMDKWYLLLVVPALLVAAWAQYKVHATFKKYSQVGTQRGDVYKRQAAPRPPGRTPAKPALSQKGAPPLPAGRQSRPRRFSRC